MTTRTTIADIAAETTLEAGIADVRAPSSYWSDVIRRFRRNWLAMLGLGVVATLILLAIFAPWICRYTPYQTNVDDKFSGLTADHWFGTDNIGRDNFAQVIYGIRISLRVGFLVAFFSSLIGVILGSISGYLGGRVDGVIMRLVDIFLAIPYIISTVALVGIIGRSVNAVIIALALTGWFIVTRVVRASFLQLKEQEFVQAARALGYGHLRIMFRHILPNAVQPVIVYTTLAIGGAILGEAALSFLAIGVQPPEPSWGLLVAENKGLVAAHPELVFFPGGAIFLTVLAFTLVGDGLRDALDPKLKA